LRATLKIGEARARDVTHFSRHVNWRPQCMLLKGSHPLQGRLWEGAGRIVGVSVSRLRRPGSIRVPTHAHEGAPVHTPRLQLALNAMLCDRAGACVCAYVHACKRAHVSRQQDACAHPQVPACLACSTPPWPLRNPARVKLGGGGAERRGREESTRRGQRRPLLTSPPSAHSAGVRVWQRRCS